MDWKTQDKEDEDEARPSLSDDGADATTALIREAPAATALGLGKPEPARPKFWFSKVNEGHGTDDHDVATQVSCRLCLLPAWGTLTFAAQRLR